MVGFIAISHVLSTILTLLPPLLYTWVYKFPAHFSRFFTQRNFIDMAQWLKIAIVVCSAPTMYYTGINGVGLCIGLPMAIVGQYLSELVYSLLGDAGVYYGIELAVVKPRNITGFPFQISDPQYRGVLLTILGILMCFNTTLEGVILLTAWTVAYFYQICLEHTRSGVMPIGNDP
jgi:hypothetical protein